jgi:hypothetical protein
MSCLWRARHKVGQTNQPSSQLQVMIPRCINPGTDNSVSSLALWVSGRGSEELGWTGT